MKHEQLVKKAWSWRRSSPDDLRAAGLMVAAHNDYMLNGDRMMFWLMTYTPPTLSLPLAFKGEGKTDEEALDLIRAAWAKYSDKLHHAPMCPANHYHGQRAPTGACNCGATVNREVI